MLNEESPLSVRTSKNLSEALPSTRQGSPNEISNTTNNVVNYDENHNDEDSANSHINRDEDEPPVDFSTNSVKKCGAHGSFSSSNRSVSPKNLTIKSEPIDLVSSHHTKNTNNCSRNSGNGNNPSNSNSNNSNNDPNNSSHTNGNNSCNIENDNDISNFNDEDSNHSEDILSDHSPPPSNSYSQNLNESDDAFQGHRNYLDSSKLFAAAGASFGFNMAAAALAADSLAGK